MAVILTLTRLGPVGATLAALIWAFGTNPLASPLVERTGQELVLALEREVARVATPAWTEAALAEAVANGEAERAAMYLGLAQDLGFALEASEAEALIARQAGWVATAQACGLCMADVAQCRSVALIGACAVPFEMSPLGDLNALRRAGGAWIDGREVDQFEAGLAVVGLGATGAALATGGSSLSVKAGSGVLRMARRMGSVSPGLQEMMTVPVVWDRVPGWLRGNVPLETVTDPAKLAALGAVANDLGRVRVATSTGDALRLMGLVETPSDARHLARIAEAAGPDTARTFAVLGKGRAIRASLRLSRSAAATLGLIGLALVQMASLVGAALGHLILRGITPSWTESPLPRREPILTRPARRLPAARPDVMLARGH